MLLFFLFFFNYKPFPSSSSLCSALLDRERLLLLPATVQQLYGTDYKPDDDDC